MEFVCLEPNSCPVQDQRETVKISTKTYKYSLLHNIHKELPLPRLPNVIPNHTIAGCSTYITRGDFAYFHYECDGVADRGWGCGYRTLQSACSWALAKRHEMNLNDIDMNGENAAGSFEEQVPSLLEIQETLFCIGDKPDSFVGSRDWIGSIEAMHVLNNLYGIECKIIHVPQRTDLKRYANVIKKYFEDFGGFVMMGGNIDTSSKGIVGIHISGNQAFYLVVDPHFVGKPKSIRHLIELGYLRWQHTSEFVDSSFYNFCLPQLK